MSGGFRHARLDPEARAIDELGEDDTTMLPEGMESGDFDGPSAEELALHVVTPPAAHHAPARPSATERLDLLEAQMAVLLTMAQIHTQALSELADALAGTPGDDPDRAAQQVARAAHDAHNLLLALRGVPD